MSAALIRAGDKSESALVTPARARYLECTMARSFRRLALFSLGTVTACGSTDTFIDVENEPAPLMQGTVQDAVASSCSTGAVLGISNQIVAQVNCLRPNTLAEIPARPNLTRSANTFAFMQPPARDALVRALDANTGMTLGINSMLRTVAQQYLLYAWYMAGRCSIMLAARPGGSNHESGLALDTSQYAAWETALEAQGFTWFGSSDVVHFDYTGPGTIDLRPVGIRGFQRLWNVNNPADTIVEDGIYGPNTESRLQQSPANGFSTPAPCGAPPDAGTADARPPDAGSPPPDSASSDAGGTDVAVSDARAERSPDVGAGGAAGSGSIDARTTDAIITSDTPSAPDGGTGGTSIADASPRPDVPPTVEPDAYSGDASTTPGELEAGCSCRVVAAATQRSASRRTAWSAALIFGTLGVVRRRGRRFAASAAQLRQTFPPCGHRNL
jgi:hypothetical protein